MCDLLLQLVRVELRSAHHSLDSPFQLIKERFALLVLLELVQRSAEEIRSGGVFLLLQSD
eukprot:NODE_5594_length_399_cov_37.680000_g4901_i0.p2 GENE.NODE_5594_length_399_cov_37.680000_g4901_i0~~NODE_5594_length_399_cov_37.680000_g4901_i0.p2  ORF type:complete len:60 (-),score=7.15 NODE_5594_length_399_cov_37.680000_g4901_i0:50-229(-)